MTKGLDLPSLGWNLVEGLVGYRLFQGGLGFLYQRQHALDRQGINFAMFWKTTTSSKSLSSLRPSAP